MKTRPNWVEIPNINSLYNFKWQPFSNGIRFEELQSHGCVKQIVNHLKHHEVISDKSNLFKTLTRYCEKKNNVFDIVPITFDIQIPPNSRISDIKKLMKPFISIYNTLKKGTQFIEDVDRRICNKEDISEEFVDFGNRESQKSLTKLKPYKFSQKSSLEYKMPLSHLNGKNFWIFKITNLNRGRGIHVFSTLDQLMELVYKYCLKKADNEFSFQNIYFNNQINEEALLTADNFIIQKYIERPLLIHKRKFDIRVWVMVSHTGKCYIFKEGYLRTSAAEFSMDESNPDTSEVHLTNNAIQKKTDGYGQFEDGNQLSYTQFQEYLNSLEDCQINFKKDIMPKIKEIIKHTLLAAKKELTCNNKRIGFEFFGFDFMLDEDFNPWLIEVNTNPCLEESSEMLKYYLRRLINDLLKLELDPIFSSQTTE